MKDFRDLAVWQKAHSMTLDVYSATRTFPKEELFSLTNQIRRAASSIPANIVEGYGRRSDVEMKRFFQIARGSATELEYHLLLSRDLGYLAATKYDFLLQEIAEVEKMLTAFTAKLKADIAARSAQDTER